MCQQAPTSTIASNAGADAPLVIGKLLEQYDLNFGYDAAKGLCSRLPVAPYPFKIERLKLYDHLIVNLCLYILYFVIKLNMVYFVK